MSRTIAICLSLAAAGLFVGCDTTYTADSGRVVVDPGYGGQPAGSAPSQSQVFAPGKAKKAKKPKHGGPPPWAPAHGYRAKHAYQYYPQSEVYYEPARGSYFWYEAGGWQVGVRLPEHIRLDSSGQVTLDMDSDQPYRYHDAVRAQYGGHR